MRESLNHLLWGVVLFSLYIVMTAMLAPLMRVCSPLAPSQTYALICLGEIFSFIPYVKLAKRKWSIKRKSEWITFGIYGLILGSNFVLVIYCSQNMPLGKPR